MFKRAVITFALLVSVLVVQAQDMHFSQYYAAPLTLNPANTGLIKGRFRLGLNSKSQWSSVTKPYQTLSAYFDMQAFRRRYRKDALGVGVVIDADIAGDSRFSTIRAGVSLSYIKSVSFRNNNFLAIGIQPAIVQRSISYAALYYENQYNGDRYDPSIDPGEAYDISNFIYFDLAAGIRWLYQRSENTAYDAGFSVSHFTRPVMSFTGDRSIRLDMKYILHGGSQHRIGYDLHLHPSLMVAMQGKYTEAMFGAMLKYTRSKRYLDQTSVNLGLYTRWADAIVVMAGFDYKGISFGVSYDVNYSKLRPASHLRGGLEFSVSYTYNKGKYRRNREIPCPIF